MSHRSRKTDDLKLFIALSRPEFIPANMGSLIIGLAWGYNTTLGFDLRLLTIVLLSFLVITIVSLVGAQINSISDYDIDLKDPLKKPLTKQLEEFGVRKLRGVIIIELLISTLFTSLLFYLRQEPIQVAIYLLATFLTYAYSANPFRLKGKTILGMLSLCLALSLLPAAFIYYSFTSQISTLFTIFLLGQTLTVYSLIIPTETRDYFGDKAMGVRTMTVWLGLSKATILASVLLVVGAVSSIYAFLATPTFSSNILLRLAPLVMVGVDLFILKAYHQLFRLSRKYEVTESDLKEVVGAEVVRFSSLNPRWITLTTQAIVFVNVVYFFARIWV